MPANAAADQPTKEVPYFRYAFNNAYNYAVLGGAAAVAAIAQDWRVAVVGAGAEALWLTFGPDSRLLRKLWFDPWHARNLQEAEEARRRELRELFDASEKARAHRLETAQGEIHRLARQNPALTADLLDGELAKVDGLAASFFDLLVLEHRYSDYLSTQDLDSLVDDCQRVTDNLAAIEDLDQHKLAQRNLTILLQRRDKLAEIQRLIDKADGQMTLIENTFRLLADQIVTMHSPAELGSQLDDLTDGVEAVKSTARETEALLEPAR